jgi:Calcineurin-like phosphoesterase
MFGHRKLRIISAVLLASAFGGAQTASTRDPRSFPFLEAADPKAVTQTEQSPYGTGTHPKGVSDPLFSAQELLGRPTDTSITISAEAVKPLEIYYEYGTKPGVYSGKTAPVMFAAGEPKHVLVDQLKPNTQYYYRMRYRESGTETFRARPEHFFHTQRPPGSTFTFDLHFDPHLAADSDEEAYRMSLRRTLADKPDFLIDLGDNMFSDRGRPATKEKTLSRAQLLHSYYDIATHSVPLLLAMGNHEGEWSRNLNASGENVAVWDATFRKRYFPNPEPNTFYTGSSKEEPLVGVRQANYAFQWGDALFVVLDPYWNLPKAPEMAGDWSLTLGREQYDWLKKTLETSSAKYKFIFSHNLIGGLNMKGQMRGGIETVKYLEMGGYNLDGTWGWDKARPGWYKPIHQLLVENNATIYFHGHDHLYAKQDLDGIVYQEGPQPSRVETDLGEQAKDYSYTHGTVLGGTGYIRVRVSPEDVKVEYVQTWIPGKQDATHKDGMIADSYTVKPRKFNPAAR